jgi:hypothetical protein
MGGWQWDRDHQCASACGAVFYAGFASQVIAPAQLPGRADYASSARACPQMRALRRALNLYRTRSAAVARPPRPYLGARARQMLRACMWMLLVCGMMAGGVRAMLVSLEHR